MFNFSDIGQVPDISLWFTVLILGEPWSNHFLIEFSPTMSTQDKQTILSHLNRSGIKKKFPILLYTR